MPDFTRLDVATTTNVSRFHNFAKNVETAHIGKLYTTVIDGLDYYFIECTAKPVLAKAPEWVSDNRVTNSILNHKGLTILAAGIISFIFFVIMLHPKGEAAKSAGTGSPVGSPRRSDDDEDSDIEGADGKKGAGEPTSGGATGTATPNGHLTPLTMEEEEEEPDAAGAPEAGGASGAAGVNGDVKGANPPSPRGTVAAPLTAGGAGGLYLLLI